MTCSNFSKFSLILLLLCFNDSNSFSHQLCQKICLASDFLCWICSGIYSLENPDSIEEQAIETLLRHPTKAELIEKAKVSLRQQKIIGGIHVKPGDLPYIISIKYREGREFVTYCGGALISEKFGISAAHCINYLEPEEVFVGIGDYNREAQDEGEMLTAVLKLIKYPTYNSLTFEGDVGLLELAQRVKFDKFKFPAALPQVDAKLDLVQFNISGWGTLKEHGESSQELRRVVVPYVPFTKCQTAYKKLGFIVAKVKEGMICAGWISGGHDACQGDSGGPLVANLPGELHQFQRQQKEPFEEPDNNNDTSIYSDYAEEQAAARYFWPEQDPRTKKVKFQDIVPTLVGVISWGLGCGRPTYAGVYTDIRFYREWILNEIETL